MINLNQYEVLTFDCYGTLIDWEKGVLEALQPVPDICSDVILPIPNKQEQAEL